MGTLQEDWDSALDKTYMLCDLREFTVWWESKSLINSHTNCSFKSLWREGKERNVISCVNHYRSNFQYHFSSNYHIYWCGLHRRKIRLREFKIYARDPRAIKSQNGMSNSELPNSKDDWKLCIISWVSQKPEEQTSSWFH